MASLVVAFVLCCLGFLWANEGRMTGFKWFFLIAGWTFLWGITHVRKVRRTLGWERAAREVGGKREEVHERDFADRFGKAPWHTWSKAYNVSCKGLIRGGVLQHAFWLFDIQYSESGLGDTDSKYEVTFAVMRLGGEQSFELQDVPDSGADLAMHNGRYLFVWMPGRMGAMGRKLRLDEFPDLLERARVVAGKVVTTPTPQPEAAPAAPDGIHRGIPLLIGAAWLALALAAITWRFAPGLVLVPTAWGLGAFGLDWRRVSSASHFVILVGCGVCVVGFRFGSALAIAAGPVLGLIAAMLIQMSAASSTTRRNKQGDLVWRGTQDR